MKKIICAFALYYFPIRKLIPKKNFGIKIGRAIGISLLSTLIITNYSSAQWIQSSNGLGTSRSITYIMPQDNNIFVSVTNYPYGYIFLSSDGGYNWSQTNFTDAVVYSIASNGNSLFAGTFDDHGNGNGKIFRTTNSGINWNQVTFSSHGILTLASDGINLFAGTRDSGVYLSTDNGSSWSHPLTKPFEIRCIWFKENNIFVSMDSSTYSLILYSSNRGINWRQSVLEVQNARTFTYIGDSIYTGTQNGIYRTTDLGLNWVKIGMDGKGITSLITCGNVMIAGTSNQGVFLSKNYGLDWIQRNQGFNTNPPIINRLYAGSDFIIAGTYLSSAWRRSINDIIVIKNISTGIPFEYQLFQNFPNPFNPSTNIKYQLTNNKLVLLKVYNILGKEIATLVNEKQSPGTYEVTFDGSTYPSGVYFYKLQVVDPMGQKRDFSETKKMLMIK